MQSRNRAFILLSLIWATACADTMEHSPESEAALYQRSYISEARAEYRMVTRTAHNGIFQSEETVYIQTLDLPARQAEQLEWLTMVIENADGDLFRRDAREDGVPAHVISTERAGGVTVPALDHPEWTGAITDFITFFVPLQSGLGMRELSEVGDRFNAPEPSIGDWADGTDILFGNDCTQPTLELTDETEFVFRVRAEFAAPETDCLPFPYEVMRERVDPETPNNFAQIRHTASGYMVMWGVETFTVNLTLGRSDSVVGHGELENHLNLILRGGCDEALENCQFEAPFTIDRNVTLNRGISVSIQQSD